MATNQLTIAPLPTAEEIALVLMQWLFATTGTPTDTNQGSIVRTYSEAIGSTEEIQAIESEAQALQALVYSAFTAFGIFPIGASGAVGTVTFSTLSTAPLPPGQSVLIPLNTIVQTQTGIQFATTATAVLVSGTTMITAPIQALSQGTIGNVGVGLINQIASGLTYPLAVTNSIPTAGGANAETASQTLARFTAYVQSLGLCSPVAIAGAVIGVTYNQEIVKYSDVYEQWIYQVENDISPLTPGFTCYDNQTEVLTENNGWKLFKDLIPYEKVATLNPNTHELEYQEPEEYQCYNYNGELVEFSSDSYNICVTSDHNIYSCSEKCDINDPSEWSLVKAQDIAKWWHIKTDAIWKGKEQEFYIISGINNHKLVEYKISMDLWLEFLGYYLSEGSCADYYGKDKNDGHGKARHRRVTITQISERGIDLIGKCLSNMPFKFHRDKSGWVTNSKELYNEVCNFGLSDTKYVPSYIKSLSKRQLKILLEALCAGDGSKIIKNEEFTEKYSAYVTTSKKLADDVQELLLKVGLVGNVSFSDRNIGKSSLVINKETGRSNIATTRLPSYIVNIRNERFCPVLGYGERKNISYEDKVYCVTVPNHIIYVRRKGKSVWCGNCFIDNGSGSASAGLINAVTTYLSSGLPAGYRPAGVPFAVSGVIPVGASVVVVAQSINPSIATAIATAVSQAIVAYFNSLNFGDTAEFTQLVAAIANASFGQLISLNVSLLDQFGNPQQDIIASPDGQRIILLSQSVTIN